MTNKKFDKAKKEIREAKEAIIDYCSYKYYSFLDSLNSKVLKAKIAASSTILNLKDAIISYSTFVYFCVIQLGYRLVGAALKLPVFLLNNIAIYGNMLQAKANRFRKKAQIAIENKHINDLEKEGK